MSGRRLTRRSMSKPVVSDNQVDVMDQLKSILGTSSLDLGPESIMKELQLPDSITSYDDLNTEMNASDTRDLPNYTEDLNHFKQLHDQINLASKTVEEYHRSLVQFQQDIDGISTDMESLQQRSLEISKKVHTQTQIEHKLAPLLEALVIPPSIVKQILDGDINARWRASLVYIRRRKRELKTLHDHDDFAATKSADQQMQLVTSKACEKIRDFIVACIRRMRMPKVNSQSIQYRLLENRELYKFLHETNEELALKLRQAYINTIKWYYSSYFGRYVKCLERFPIDHPDKSVLLASEDTGKSWILGGSTNQSHRPQDYMNIGTRPAILTVEASPLSIEKASSKSVWIEEIYRSMNLALADNVAVEHQFLTDFFGVAGDIDTVFNEIFRPTFDLANEFVETLISESYDAYGLLLCIRIADKIQKEGPHVSALDEYLDSQLLLLWPRFQNIMDMHCESLRKASTKSSSFAMANQSAVTLVPHRVTQHYASFVSGLLSLCEGYHSETEPVANSLLRLRSDFESFLTKISAVLNNQNSDKQETFLYNNYFLVYTILSDSEGSLSEQEKEHFKLLTEAYEKGTNKGK